MNHNWRINYYCTFVQSIPRIQRPREKPQESNTAYPIAAPRYLIRGRCCTTTIIGNTAESRFTHAICPLYFTRRRHESSSAAGVHSAMELPQHASSPLTTTTWHFTRRRVVPQQMTQSGGELRDKRKMGTSGPPVQRKENTTSAVVVVVDLRDPTCGWYGINLFPSPSTSHSNVNKVKYTTAAAQQNNVMTLLWVGFSWLGQATGAGPAAATASLNCV